MPNPILLMDLLKDSSTSKASLHFWASMVSGRSSGITISTILTSSRDSTPSSIAISSTRSIARASSASSTPSPPPPISQSLSSRPLSSISPVSPLRGHRYHRALDLQLTEASPWVYGAYSSRRGTRRGNMGLPLRPEGGRSL